MNITTLQHNATRAQIGISVQPGRQSIQQPKAVLDLKQPKAEMTIQTTPGKLFIDQSQAFADAGLKSVFQWTREAASKGQQQALEGTGRRAMEGRELADIHKNGEAISMQAKRASNQQVQTGLAWIPSHGSVKIDYQVGDVTIDVQTHRVENRTRAQKPIISYEPGQVNVQIKQHASLSFQAVNKTI